jgi:hypothetical protein
MVCYVCGCLHESILYMEECLLSWASYYRHVRLAYQPLANSTFLSDQTSHQQPASSIFLSEQISTSHQPNEQAIRASKKGEVLVTHKLGLYQADGLIPRQHPLNFHLCFDDLSMLDTIQWFGSSSQHGPYLMQTRHQCFKNEGCPLSTDDP